MDRVEFARQLISDSVDELNSKKTLEIMFYFVDDSNVVSKANLFQILASQSGRQRGCYVGDAIASHANQLNAQSIFVVNIQHMDMSKDDYWLLNEEFTGGNITVYCESYDGCFKLVQSYEVTDHYAVVSTGEIKTLAHDPWSLPPVSNAIKEAA